MIKTEHLVVGGREFIKTYSEHLGILFTEVNS